MGTIEWGLSNRFTRYSFLLVGTMKLIIQISAPFFTLFAFGVGFPFIFLPPVVVGCLIIPPPVVSTPAPPPFTFIPSTFGGDSMMFRAVRAIEIVSDFGYLFIVNDINGVLSTGLIILCAYTTHVYIYFVYHIDRYCLEGSCIMYFPPLYRRDISIS